MGLAPIFSISKIENSLSKLERAEKISVKSHSKRQGPFHNEQQIFLKINKYETEYVNFGNLITK